MATQVKLRRGTLAQHAAFTGAVAEVTVVTDSPGEMRVHDGVTPGGASTRPPAAAPTFTPVATLAALGDLDITKTTLAFLTAEGIERQWVYRAGNYQARVTADPLRRQYMPRTGANGSLGAWVAVGWVPTHSKFTQPPVRLEEPGRLFFENLGARIHRMRDRVFVGEAVYNRGLSPETAGSDDYIEDDFQNTTSLSQFACLSANGQIAVSGGSQTAFSPGAGSMGCIGVMGRVLNNNANQVQSAYGAYFDAVRSNGAGNTHGMEVNIVNKAAQVPPQAFPHNIQGAAGQLSNALWVASGGEVATQDATSAIAIVNNGRGFGVGIVFQNNSLIGDKTAIAMSADHHIRWFWADSGQPRRQDEGNGMRINGAAGAEHCFIGSEPAAQGILLRTANGRINLQGVNGIAGTGAAMSARIPIYVNGDLWYLPLYTL